MYVLEELEANIPRERLEKGRLCTYTIDVLKKCTWMIYCRCTYAFSQLFPFLALLYFLLSCLFPSLFFPLLSPIPSSSVTLPLISPLLYLFLLLSLPSFSPLFHVLLSLLCLPLLSLPLLFTPPLQRRWCWSMQVATVKDYHMSVCWARSSWLYPVVRHQVEVRLMLRRLWRYRGSVYTGR